MLGERLFSGSISSPNAFIGWKITKGKMFSLMLLLQSVNVIRIPRNSPFNTKLQKFRFVLPEYSWPALKVVHFDRTKISLSIWQIVVPSTALLYPGYKNNNQARGDLVRVCATWMYRFIRHVKFPNFQTLEWKAPPNSSVSPTGWVIDLHPFKPFLPTKPIHHR